MTPAERYVAAAYLVVFVLVLAWVAIIGAKLQGLGSKLSELERVAADEDAHDRS